MGGKEDDDVELFKEDDVVLTCDDTREDEDDGKREGEDLRRSESFHAEKREGAFGVRGEGRPVFAGMDRRDTCRSFPFLESRGVFPRPPRAIERSSLIAK
jgi:hypothetical protein